MTGPTPDNYATELSCSWFIQPNGVYRPRSVIVSYFDTRASADPYWTPASVAGVRGATERPSHVGSGGCQVQWNTSFGRILVTGPAYDTGPPDSCALVEAFASALVPGVPD